MTICLYRRILLTAEPIWFYFILQLEGPEMVLGYFLKEMILCYFDWGGGGLSTQKLSPPLIFDSLKKGGGAFCARLGTFMIINIKKAFYECCHP